MLLLAEVFDEAGFPKGVINVLSGSGAVIGNALVQNPDVDMVAMTGGTETGRRIIGASQNTVKEIALELGGKSPNIMFDDVDVDDAAKWGRWGFTLNSGQVCVSGTRLIVHRSIYEEFLEKLKAEAEKMVPGDGFDPNTTLSTLIHKEHAATVWDYIEKGKKEGARLICGGVPYEDENLKKGNFVPVTVFADVTPDMDYSEMCDKLMDAMTKIKIDGLTGVDGITWEKNGEPNKAPKGVKIENGAYVSMD